MVRSKHPNKDIEATLQYAEKYRWTVKKSKGSAHCWGQMLCPSNNKACRGGICCQQSVWSTPKSPLNHSRALKRIVDKCQFLGDDND